MKNSFTIILLFISCLVLNAQYSFTKFTDTYTSLTGATDVTGGSYWHAENSSFTAQENIPLGFNFPVKGYGINKADVDLAGSLTLYYDTVIGLELIAFNAILESMAFSSPVQYVTTGTAGNRIFKIEFKNVRFAQLNNAANYTNFQVWLYEATGVIEYRYGSSQYANPVLIFAPFTGPIVGLGTYSISEEYLMLLTGPGSNPAVQINPEDVATLTSAPANGVGYRFTPGATDLPNTHNNISFSLYPNPSSDFVQVTSPLPIQEVTITDLSGRIIYTGTVNSNQFHIPVSDFAKGLYLVKCATTNGYATTKLQVE